jgi:hypothetical protein
MEECLVGTGLLHRDKSLLQMAPLRVLRCVYIEGLLGVRLYDGVFWNYDASCTLTSLPVWDFKRLVFCCTECTMDLFVSQLQLFPCLTRNNISKGEMFPPFYKVPYHSWIWNMARQKVSTAQHENQQLPA